jgi:hypothetical protein
MDSAERNALSLKAPMAWATKSGRKRLVFNSANWLWPLIDLTLKKILTLRFSFDSGILRFEKRVNNG